MTKFEMDFNRINKMLIFKSNPKLLVRLKQNVELKQFYENHQLVKTIHFRCMMNREMYEEALALIYSSICYFASESQVYCAFDLAKVYVETLKKLEYPKLTLETIEEIKTIHKSLEILNVDDRNEFVVSILKWSSNLPEEQEEQKEKEQKEQKEQKEESIFTFYHQKYLKNHHQTFGNNKLHSAFAQNFCQEENYEQGRYHFLHSCCPQLFARMIIKIHLNYGYPSEIDLFLAQTVLQYLAVRNIKNSFELFHFYLKQHPKLVNNYEKVADEDIFYCAKYPLINFIQFLFEVLIKKDSKMFNTIINVYKPSLDRDPTFYQVFFLIEKKIHKFNFLKNQNLLKYLDRIGDYFLGIKKAKPSTSNNIFNNIIKMISNKKTNQNNSNNNNNNSLQNFLSMNEGEEEEEEEDYEEDDQFVVTNDKDDLD
jgi:golgi to ER traffic protein 4